MKKYTSLVRNRESDIVNPCKRIKRSISADLFSTSKNTSIESNGLLSILPMELKFNLFGYLTINDLGVLSTVSKQLRTVVELYCNSRTCQQLKALQVPHSNSVLTSRKKDSLITLYRQTGFLYKRISFLYSTSLRISIMEDVLKRHMCETGSEKCCALQCPSLVLLGHLLRAFLGGWEEVECHKAFHSLVHVCFKQNFWRKLTTLVYSNPGIVRNDSGLLVRACRIERDFEIIEIFNLLLIASATYELLCSLPSEELQVRLFLRRVFLDPYCDHHDFSPALSSDKFPLEGVLTNPAIECARWIMRIMKSWPIVHQARILFNLYGPLHKGRLMWRAMCENTAADAEQVRACFGELGWVFRLLHKSGQWSDDDAISVLDELTAVPEDWLAENVACLLHTSGQPLASHVIASKAVNGRSAELAVTLTSLCLVQVKVRANLSTVLQLVEEACKAASSLCDKRQFLDQLSRAFQDVIIDLYETDEIDNRLEDFSTLLRAQADFVRALLGKVFEE